MAPTKPAAPRMETTVKLQAQVVFNAEQVKHILRCWLSEVTASTHRAPPPPTPLADIYVTFDLDADGNDIISATLTYTPGEPRKAPSMPADRPNEDG